MSTALDYALKLAAHNIPAFPCAASKRPARPKAEGGQGFKDATTDPSGLAELWRRWPGPLVGVPTGTASGISVLDIDSARHPEAGDWLAANRPRLPQTREHVTGSSGRHLLFRHQPGVVNSEGKHVNGVDTRGEGGYFIWWASAGREIACKAPLAPWPQWLSEWLWPPPPPAPPPHRTEFRSNGEKEDHALRIMSRVLARLEQAHEGERHFRLRAAACTIGGLLDLLDLDASHAQQVLVDAVQRSGAPDLNKAADTAAWGIEKGRRSPFRLGDAA